LDHSSLLGIFFTVAGTVFIAELTDKDALLILALATKLRPMRVFAAGSIAFLITTTIIVSIGSLLVRLVPILWIKLVGGGIMIVYALWEYTRGPRGDESEMEREETRIIEHAGKGTLLAFLAIVAALAILDLAGDATEVVILVFLAQFNEALLVFVAGFSALVAATAVETAIGNTLGRLLAAKRIRYLSVCIFLTIGTVIILTAILLP
jgi:putative Ca2+/H+ antiporter (TMEM165/GDT1 family)